MLLEYLFFDKSKKDLVEQFNEDLKEHWNDSKKKDSPPNITYKDFDESDCWIVRYEKNGNSEPVAIRFSGINEKMCEKFSPTILTDESAEYFNKSLYPLVNQFERRLRKLLYLKVSLSKEEKLKSAIRDIEDKDFGDIYNILFVDTAFRSAARDKIKKLNTRSEMLEALDTLSERTAWDMLIGDSSLAIIKENFDQLKDYRNDVMHAHNIGESKYKAAKELFSDANQELEEQISDILQYPSEVVVPAASVDALYDKLVPMNIDPEKVAENLSRALDVFTKLSTASISPETVNNLEKILLFVGCAAESIKESESKDTSAINDKSLKSSESKASEYE